jgi:NTP pyrophosphatase (non-canonical NTP hydrolase)
MPTLETQMKRYYRVRGLKLSDRERPNGVKLREETEELVEALQGDDHLHTQHEIGDVAIVLARYAKQLGTTVEECIALKTVKDKGRNKNG